MKRRNIEVIDQQILELKIRRAQVLSRESVAERKRRTRQSILVGAFVMSNKPELAAAIAKALRRDQDRAAFGLPPWQDKTTGLFAHPQVDIPLPIDQIEAQQTPSQKNEG